MPTIFTPLEPMPRLEKGESKKKSWEEDAGEAAVLLVDQVAAECMGVSRADQACEWDESVTSDWDALGRNSGIAKGPVAESRDAIPTSRKGSRFWCWVAMCLIDSGLLTRLEAYFGTYSSSSSSPELSSSSEPLGLRGTLFVPPRKTPWVV